jgi:hypothetical protein
LDYKVRLAQQVTMVPLERPVTRVRAFRVRRARLVRMVRRAIRVLRVLATPDLRERPAWLDLRVLRVRRLVRLVR